MSQLIFHTETSREAAVCSSQAKKHSNGAKDWLIWNETFKKICNGARSFWWEICSPRVQMTIIWMLELSTQYGHKFIRLKAWEECITVALFRAEQTLVVVKAQALPIFIKIALNKGNNKSVSNLYRQVIHNKTHFRLKMYYFLISKTLKISQNLKS